MGVPDYQTLMLTVLRLTAQGVARVPEILPSITREFSLTDEDVARMLPKGRTTQLASNAHWARTYLSKAGLVRSLRRGHFEITDRGRALLAERPERIDNGVLRRYPEFVAWLDRARGGVTTVEAHLSSGEGVAVGQELAAALAGRAATIAPPQQRIEEAAAELESALADDLLARLLDGSPRFFEKAVRDLLTSMGYGGGRDGAGKRVGGSGDGGIDVVIDEDALGLDAVYVQAKRYAPGNTVGRPAIQQFVGSLQGEGATKGVFVTTSSFSADAERYKDKVSQRIVLIDGQRLARLMIAHGVGVQTTETIAIREIDENFFVDD
jgi:restriction system protein